MKIKRILALVLSAVLCLSLLAGCGNSSEKQVVIYSNADEEAVTAMQSGVVDGLDTVKSSIHSYGIDEMSGVNVWISNHMFSSVGVVINNDILASLPAEYQDILFSEWEKAYTALNEQVKQEDADFEDTYREAGANVTYTKDPSEFIEIFKDYYYKDAGTNGYTELLDEMLAIISEMNA